MFIHETYFLFHYSENIHDSQVLPKQSYIPIGGVDGSGVVYIRPLPKGFSDPLREKPKFIFERFHPWYKLWWPNYTHWDVLFVT